MKKMFFVFGGRYNTTMSKVEIEQKLQAMYDNFYGLDAVKFEYNIVSNNEIKLSWERNYSYALSGNFISDYDMEMVTCLPLEHFRPQPLGEPKVAPLIPMGKNFYAPAGAFAKLYDGMLQAIGGNAKKIRIVTGDAGVYMTIRFA